MVATERSGNLEALRVALQDALGFTLMFVEAPIGPARDALMNTLRAWSGHDEVPRLEFVHVGVAEKPFDRLAELKLAPESRTGVVLTGLDWLLVGNQLSPAAHALNLGRDLLPRMVPGPLVIVAESELLRAVSEQFPDLYSWRSFETRAPAAASGERSPTGPTASYARPRMREEYERLRTRLARASRDRVVLRLNVARLALNLFDTEEADRQLQLARDEAWKSKPEIAGLWRCISGDVALGRSRLESAESHFQRALDTTKGRSLMIEALSLTGLGRVASARGELLKARAMIERALWIHRRLGEPLAIANNLRILSQLARRTGDLHLARTCLEQARERYRALESELGEASCIEALAHLANVVSDVSTARQSFELARTMYESIDEPIGVIGCLLNLAHIAIDQCELVKAEHLIAAARLKGALVPASVMATSVLRSQAVLERDRGRHFDALGTLDEAARLAAGNSGDLADVLDIRGDVRWDLGDLPGARADFDAALQTFRVNGFLLGVSAASARLGGLALEERADDEARGHFTTALTSARALNAPRPIAACVIGLARLALHDGALEEARSHADEALQIARRIELRHLESDALRVLAEIAEAACDTALAREHATEALELHRRVENVLTVGHLHALLARVADDPQTRARHLDAARAAWGRIPRPDLLATLPTTDAAPA